MHFLVPPTIDDIYVCAFYMQIDGPSGVIGYGGPQRLRGRYVFDATIVIDLADVEQLQQNDGHDLIALVQHELGHCVRPIPKSYFFPVVAKKLTALPFSQL